MIHLDTSVLIDAFTGPRRSAAALRHAISEGERLGISALVLYEWLRGPRRPEELRAQQAIVPVETAVPFGPAEAARAADLYRVVPRARQRVADLAIAASALLHEAYFWTLDPEDFRDIPGLSLYTPSRPA